MTESLTWDEIKEQYDRQWVELVQYDWPEGKPYPNSGVVRVHSSNRKEFYQLAKSESPRDSAILFVGKPDVPPNTILCSSVMRLTNADN